MQCDTSNPDGRQQEPVGVGTRRTALSSVKCEDTPHLAKDRYTLRWASNELLTQKRKTSVGRSCGHFSQDFVTKILCVLPSLSVPCESHQARTGIVCLVKVWVKKSERTHRSIIKAYFVSARSMCLFCEHCTTAEERINKALLRQHKGDQCSCNPICRSLRKPLRILLDTSQRRKRVSYAYVQ